MASKIVTKFGGGGVTIAGEVTVIRENPNQSKLITRAK